MTGIPKKEEPVLLKDIVMFRGDKELHLDLGDLRYYHPDLLDDQIV